MACKSDVSVRALSEKCRYCKNVPQSGPTCVNCGSKMHYGCIKYAKGVTAVDSETIICCKHKEDKLDEEASILEDLNNLTCSEDTAIEDMAIGGSNLESMDGLIEAQRYFEGLYEDKMGNYWDMRHNFQFVKMPGWMYPIDIDYVEDEFKLEIPATVGSKLRPEVQELIRLIFNIDSMKKQMLDRGLDTEKMPLERLSKLQIKKSYSVLCDLQAMVGKKTKKAMLINASNRFYTIVPHSVTLDQDLPLLDNEELIKQKIDMIDNLMEIEIAYNLIKSASSSALSSASSSASSSADIDGLYAQLKTDIDVLDRRAFEFKIIEEYVRNTHASTHNKYELEIVNVFVISRHGEEKRFTPLHNRKLLWHGSRTANFAYILSQGLKIPPKEKPVTGMFGKGIYFADMVSKSANYCRTKKSSPTGLMLLCDVALGEMYERLEADNIEKLPEGKHSCKGVGRTYPDPKTVKYLFDKVEVPLGKPVKDNRIRSELLYNEFIIYNVAQVNIKYLLQLNFKYKY